MNSGILSKIQLVLKLVQKFNFEKGEYGDINYIIRMGISIVNVVPLLISDSKLILPP